MSSTADYLRKHKALLNDTATESLKTLVAILTPDQLEVLKDKVRSSDTLSQLHIQKSMVFLNSKIDQPIEYLSFDLKVDLIELIDNLIHGNSEAKG